MSIYGDNWGLIGHEWAVNLLRTQVARGQVGHAYLITGVAQIGKTTLAMRFAQAMNCTAHLPPCGTCRSCDLFERGVHPDMLMISPEGRSIRIEAIRDLQNVLSLQPYEARYRVALILNIQQATDQAADSLLKTLEEPPSATRLLLTAEAVEAVRPTIVSRCRVIPLRPAPGAPIEEALRRLGMAPEKAHVVARLSGGRPGWALTVAQSPQVLEQRAQVVHEMLTVLRGDRSVRFSYSEEIAGRDWLPLILDTWQSWWRDVLLLAEGSGVRLVNEDYWGDLQWLAGQISPQQARQALRSVRSTIDALDQNANTRLALDVMLLDMPYVS